MEIHLNNHIDSVARTASSHSAASRTVRSRGDLAAFESSEALEAHLRDLPDVRQDKLQRALELVGDPAYPPRETINGLANLLAVHLENSAEEE